jgi:cellulose synthase/poly-beta-1,6-N-acetylglucosamine synthase-like glycosyltransferase
MLKETVIFAGILLTLSSLCLFVAGSRLRRTHWLLSILTMAGLAGFALLCQRAFTGRTLPAQATLLAMIALSALVAACFEHWNPIGHASFAAAIVAAVTFLAYAGYVSIAARLGPWSLAFAILLFLLQAGTLVLLVANMFEVIDVICRTKWNRVQGPKRIAGYEPKVSLHVPIHSEPPELVIKTLDALAKLSYANYEVLVIDNNTADEELWRPVEAHCARLEERFQFFHLMPWPGYKSGALNFALNHTAGDAEIIAVVDADYVVEPEFLADLVGHFADPNIAFVQTPQDYSDQLVRGRYGKALYLAYLYFFKISMATRNEYNGIIYAGTMGLIRKSALLQVGGWNEWCITEDAELSLRLLHTGYQSVYVDRTYGRGLMPLDYAGLKKQRFRWAFGGMQILRLHAGKLMNPGQAGKLTLGQRFAYLSGGLQWLNDPMALGFTLILWIATASLLLGHSFSSQPLTGGVILVPPLFILFALMRFIWAFRIRSNCSWRHAMDALTILLGLNWVVTLACLRGLVSREGVFLRTPKQGEQPGFLDSMRIVQMELLMGSICLVGAVALVGEKGASLPSAWGITLGLLFWQASTYLAAVRTSIWSYFENRPPNTPRFLSLFSNSGYYWGRFITEFRAATLLLIIAALVGGVFFIGRQQAPLSERIELADPLNKFLPARSVLRPSEEEQAGAALIQEANDARQGDVAAALKLWDSDGVIVDASDSSVAGASARVWKGLEELKQRYLWEFSERHYESLRHLNLKISVHGNEAVILDDLDAVVETHGEVQHLVLPRTDKWVLRREGADWKIVRLEVNRNLQTDSGGANERIAEKKE